MEPQVAHYIGPLLLFPSPINPLTPELKNKSLRATLPAEKCLLGILIFKGLIVQRLYKSFGVKGLMDFAMVHHILFGVILFISVNA
jgi:hypothetical protein